MKEIIVNESDLNFGKIMDSVLNNRTTEHKIEELIAVRTITEDALSRLKVYKEAIDGELYSKTFAVERACAIGPAGDADELKEPFKVKVVHKNGTTTAVTLSPKMDNNFAVSEKIREVVALDVVPEKYKRREIRLNKKLMEEEFVDGTMPAEVAAFCSTSPVEIISMKKTVIKPAKSKD